MPSSTNRAHRLAECSNAGLCDRASGKCTCFPGFEGNTQLYYIEREDFIKFLQAYPGIKLRMLDKVGFKGKNVQQFGTISDNMDSTTRRRAHQPGVVQIVEEGNEDMADDLTEGESDQDCAE